MPRHLLIITKKVCNGGILVATKSIVCGTLERSLCTMELLHL